MEPILDETTLVPCASWEPGRRIDQLASTLSSLDRLGGPRVLRTTRDSVDRDIGEGSGLRRWCFARGAGRDAGRFVASRLAKQPYVDGSGGLFERAEGPAAVSATLDGEAAAGAGLAALVDGVLVGLPRATLQSGSEVLVDLVFLGEHEERTERAPVFRYLRDVEVEARSGALSERFASRLSTGRQLLANAAEVLPNLQFGATARRQIDALTGNEPMFAQLVRHLRALNQAAEVWPVGKDFDPTGITWSDESNPTLSHGIFGPMRDFPVPPGFAAQRFRYHTKLSGGAEARLYFHSDRVGKVVGGTVLIGYVGPHLPTVRHP